MNRRGFIGMFAAAAVLDPDRLLWVRGAKTISIPKPRPRIVHVSRYLLDGASYSASISIDWCKLVTDDLRTLGDLSKRLAAARTIEVEAFTSGILFPCK